MPLNHEPSTELSHETQQLPEARVGILNFRSQHTLEISDASVEQGIRAEVMPYDTPSDKLKKYKALIFSGGDRSVYDDGSPRPDPKVYELGVPILGICYGAQLLAEDLGGKVVPGENSEFGQHKITKLAKEPVPFVFTDHQTSQTVWMNHGDRIDQVPEGWTVSSISENGMIASFSSANGMLTGVQFHPEVQGEGRTEGASDMWARFFFDIAKIEPNFKAEDVAGRVARIKREVAGRQVLLFLSGGVDSNVTGGLAVEALGSEQVYAVHVDHGFMRENESEEVVEALADRGMKVYHEDAADYFLNSTTVIDGIETPTLRNAVDPEIKRKIAGDAFIRYQQTVADRLGLKDDYVLMQGTIRPDLIESGSHGTTTIKSHHNDSPLARELRKKGRVIEPVADLYKPGVRAIGRAIGLPTKLVERQPFPGPGTIIRILCRDNPELSQDESAALYDTAASLGSIASSTIGMTVIPVRSVGQRAEGRSYGQTVVISGGGTWAEREKYSRLITGTNRNINRVAHAFGDTLESPVSTLLTHTMLGPDTAFQLRQADSIVRAELTAADLDVLLQQVPVILLPTGIDKEDMRSVVVRPFRTINFQTGTAAIPGTEFMPEEVLDRIVDRLMSVKGISRVLYDLTGKPPGTTEWE